MDPALKAILAKRQSLSADSRAWPPEDAKQNWPRASAPAAAAKPPDWRAELAAARAQRRQSDSPLEAKELPPGDSPLKPAPRPPWEADGGNVARLRKSMQAAAPAATPPPRQARPRSGSGGAVAERAAMFASSGGAPPPVPAAPTPPRASALPAAAAAAVHAHARVAEAQVAMIERHRALGDGGASAASAEAGGGGGEGAACGTLWAQLVAVTEQKEALEVELATSVAGAARLELITSAITARLREQLAALAAGGLTTTEERRHYAALQELLAYQEQLQDAPDEQLPERSRPTVARPLPGTPDGAAAGAVARRRRRRRAAAGGADGDQTDANGAIQLEQLDR